MGSDAPETVAAIVAAHRAGTLTPAQTVARSYKRIGEHNDPAVFISLRDERDALAEAEALSAKGAEALPLLGVPVAVKDNVDARGMATTAACPAVEALCLVGLQRFRPLPADRPRVFDYWAWLMPLPLLLAPAAACGLLPGATSARYRFENAFRTDQRKHKGYMPATQIGETR